MIMEKEVNQFQYYLELIFKENKMRIALKFLLGFFMFRIISGQELPQPVILGEDIKWPTIRVSQFVKVDESTGIKDDRVTLGIRQLLEEELSNTRYKLVDDDNADFTVDVEVLYIGKPNEGFSVIGLFNRRKQSTEVKLLVNLKDNKLGNVRSHRGSGEIETNISATGLQIEEEAEFGNSELGGAVRKAINNAVQKIK
mgnify:FL=1|tara:strand:- start:1045 stop:1638 length:594 start_codon:yes stop_codon:yes gene_type:complete